LAPAEHGSKETLIRTRSTSVPTLVLYLVPVMAALVLGGVYIGIKMLREQLQQTPPIVVEVPSAASKTAGDGTAQKLAGTEAPLKKAEAPRSETAQFKEKKQESTPKAN